MKLAIIGRSGMLYESVLRLSEEHDIKYIITSKASPEYIKDESDFKKLAQKLKAEFIFTSDINSEDIVSLMKKEGLDIAVSVNCVNIIKREIIESFRYGILNAHAGDLPKYRGNACPNWAILNGEDKIALSIHYMEPDKLDSGDITAQAEYILNENTYIGDIYKWLYRQVPELFLESVSKIESDAGYYQKKQSTDPGMALRTYPRVPADSYIDWNLDSLNIHRIIRAGSEPFKGAFTFFKSEKMVIWRAEIVEDEESYCAVPGQVCAIETDGSVVVIAGHGKLRITEIDYCGMERVKPAEVIKSIRNRLGVNLIEEYENLRKNK